MYIDKIKNIRKNSYIYYKQLIIMFHFHFYIYHTQNNTYMLLYIIIKAF